MATISLLFIAVFILVQGALGVMLLFRGFALARLPEPGTLWRMSARRLKNAIQNISL